MFSEYNILLCGNEFLRNLDNMPRNKCPSNDVKSKSISYLFFSKSILER